MAALLTVRGDSKEKVLDNLKEAKRMGIKILPPNINKSTEAFNPEDEGIRFGMQSIDGVGEKAVLYIINERQENGSYKDFDDFIQRIVKDFVKTEENKTNPVNRGVIRQLIKAGCFDDFEKNRYALLNYYNLDIRRDKVWIGSEEELSKSSDKSNSSIKYDVDSFTEKRMLQMEFDLIGIYVTKSPYENLPYVSISDMEPVRGWGKSPTYDVGGRITKVKQIKIKNGKSKGRSMAHITIETQFDNYRITAFADEYEDNQPYLYTDNILIFRVYRKPGNFNGVETDDLILTKILVKEANKLKKEMGIQENEAIKTSLPEPAKEKPNDMFQMPVKEDPVSEMFDDRPVAKRKRKRELDEDMKDLFGL